MKTKRFRCHFCGKRQHRSVRPKSVPVKINLIVTDIVERKIGHEDWPRRRSLISIFSLAREKTVEEVLACPRCAKKIHVREVVEVIFTSKSLEADEKHQALASI